MTVTNPIPSLSPRRRGAARSVLRCVVLMLLALAGLTACVRRPDYVLDDDRMTRLLLDVHRAEALLEMQDGQYPADAQKRDVMGAVLVRNGVSREQYDSSLVWYGQHLKSLISIYNRIADSLQAERETWQAVVAAAAAVEPYAAGDSVELWRKPAYTVLDTRRQAAFMCRSIDADTTFLPGDSVAWSLRLRGVLPPAYVVATISWTSESDSTVAVTEVLRHDTLVALGLAADTARPATSVVMSLALMSDSLPASDPDGLSVLVDSISAVRYHRP